MAKLLFFLTVLFYSLQSSAQAKKDTAAYFEYGIDAHPADFFRQMDSVRVVNAFRELIAGSHFGEDIVITIGKKGYVIKALIRIESVLKRERR